MKNGFRDLFAILWMCFGFIRVIRG